MPRSVSLASHTASSLSVLGLPGACFTSCGPDQLHIQPGRLQQVEPDSPVIGG